MQVADWIRASLWPQIDWREGLRQLCQHATADSRATAARLSDLAAACELIEPDRRVAVALHQLTWRAGNSPGALDRAYDLARELGDHEMLAGLAMTAHEVTRDAAHLVTAAHAFLDGNRPALAESAFARVLEARPKDDEAKALLAMLRHQLRDPQAEVSGAVARASRASGADAGRLYLHAARLARLAGLEAIFTRHLETAFQRGHDPAAAMLIEADLMERRRANDLLAFYRGRIEAAGNDREWADLMRAAGTRLVLANVQRGLALRMLRSGLEAAYRARLADIPGHIASWDLLIHHARDNRSTRELMPLVAEAMAAPIGDDARLFLARFGFEVTWREAKDADAAKPYAAAISEYLPGDDDLHDFVSASLPALTTYEPPAAPLPPEPTFVRMKPRAPAQPLPEAALTALRSGDRKPGVPTSPPLPAQAAPRAERVVVPADVEVHHGDQVFAAVVRDLSATGLYVITHRELAVDSIVTVVIELPRAGVLEVTRYEARARIVRRAYTGYGMLLLEPAAELVAAITALAPR